MVNSVKYKNIYEGIFLERPNRFIARVLIDGKEEVSHVKNTGRCHELLVPGARVFLEKVDAPGRKTSYDLVSVYKGERLINIDSSAPNAVAGAYLKGCFPDALFIKPESTFRKSRFDFYIETPLRKIFTEVKGVTLERNGVVFFPDAPTQRGRKHLLELICAKKLGFEAMMLFVVQMEGTVGFAPNDLTDPLFGKLLLEARNAGVCIRVVECRVAPDEMRIIGSLPLLF